MKGRKKLIKERNVILSVIFFFIFLNFVSAVNVGVSPASISFKEVLRGGYAERVAIVSADSDKPVLVNIKPRGEIAEWLNFSEEEFTVSKDNPYFLKISVLPPSDIPNGDYNGFLRIEVGSSAEFVEEHAVGMVKSSLDLAISVEIIDIEIARCVASDLEVLSSEKGEDIILKMKISNEGNIRLKPDVVFDIWDFDKITILDSEQFLSDEIMPSTEKEVKFKFNSNDFDPGQYWSEVSVLDCSHSQILTFDILEPGSLSAKGVLLNILTKGVVNVGETSSIIVNFKNIGEKEVNAQFRGEVTKNGKIIDIFESEISKVPVSAVEEFNFYFTPKTEGKYIVSGRVYYDKKKTFEMSSSLEVVREGGISFVWGVYLLFFLGIGFLFYRIRKEKKIYLDRLGRLK